MSDRVVFHALAPFQGTKVPQKTVVIPPIRANGSMLENGSVPAGTTRGPLAPRLQGHTKEVPAWARRPSSRDSGANSWICGSSKPFASWQHGGHADHALNLTGLSPRAPTMNLLARKLDHFADLGVEDKQLLDELIKGTRRVAARRDIIKEGERPNSVHLILSGFACRYRDHGGRHASDCRPASSGRLLRSARRHFMRDGSFDRHSFELQRSRQFSQSLPTELFSCSERGRRGSRRWS